MSRCGPGLNKQLKKNTKQQITRQNNNNTNNKSKKKKTRRTQRSTMVNVFSRKGGMPYVSEYEGKGNVMASITVKDGTGSYVDEDCYPMYVITNAGYGNTVGFAYAIRADTAAGSVAEPMTTPYLDDASITASRALKSSIVFQNTTAIRHRRPGVYVLTTSQRFATAGSTPTTAELRNIRAAVIGHPETKYYSGDVPTEVFNVALADADYRYYRNVSNFARTVYSYDQLDVRRPMTVTYIVPAYKIKHTPTEIEPNQTYRIDVYTANRTRHSMNSILSTLAANPTKGSSTSASAIKTGQDAQKGL
jgi:hypothetical protein